MNFVDINYRRVNVFEMKELLKRLRAKNIRICLVDEKLDIEAPVGAVDSDLLKEIKENKEGLIAFFKQYEEKAKNHKEIPSVQLQNCYPVSDGQRRLWLQSQMEGGSEAYNMPFHVNLDESYDIDCLKKAIDSTIERHEILRTVFRLDSEGEIKQWILPKEELNFEIDFQDFQNLSDKEKVLQDFIAQDSRKTIDLENGPLFRSSFIQIDKKKYVFYYNIHHIIGDAWSLNILNKDIFEYYNSYKKGVSPNLPKLRIQYKDYASWQLSQVANNKLVSQKDFWLKSLAGNIPSLELPSNKTRPKLKSFDGKGLSTLISPTIGQKIKDFSEANGGSLFIGLLAVCNVLFHKYGAGEDVIIGTPVAGRDHLDLEDQIGFYVNTLALRNKINPNENFNEFFSRVKKSTLLSFSNQQYPFDRLVEDLKLKRDISRNPVFDVLMSLQNIRENENKLDDPDKRAKQIVEVGNCISKFDLEITFQERSEGLLFDIIYSSELYEIETIKRFMLHFKELIFKIFTSPDLPIENIDFLLPNEEFEQIEQFNDTNRGFPKDKTLVDLFNQQTKTSPDKKALIFDNKVFTFGELDQLSNKFANYLSLNYNIRKGELVGIKLERNEWLVISLLSVLKLGAAYVPIDPKDPVERQEYIQKDSCCKLSVNEFELKRFQSQVELYSGSFASQKITPDDLAYIIYTSGSTGKPKGCKLLHKGVVNRIDWMWHALDFKEDEVVIQKTKVTFDVSVWELFLPLCWGNTMVLGADDDIYSPENLVRLINRHKVNTIHFVPSMFKAFISYLQTDMEGIRSINKVITSGEALSIEEVKSWYKLTNAKLHNLYGPTEASIDVSFYKTSVNDIEVPIGKPIQNTQLYVLGQNKKILPKGVIGEIWIGGIGLSTGYLNRLELTAEKFVKNPFNKGTKLYCTGDLGKWREDGQLLYLGRKDDQVKIRGYRIELKEIENTLLGFDEVQEVVVVAKDYGKNEKELVAYFKAESDINIIDLRYFLRKFLPDYMVPLHFLQIDEIPLSGNGKVDKKSLPDVNEKGGGIQNNYVEPRNELENQLAHLWSGILHRKRIGITDDFFDLGGQSLKAIRLLNEFQKSFNLKLKLKDIFEVSTIKDQVLLIKNSPKKIFKEIEPVKNQLSYPLSFAQHRLWVLSQLEDSSVVNNLQTVYTLSGNLNFEALSTAFKMLIDRHESLRTVFKENDLGEVQQFILPKNKIEFSIDKKDIRGLANEEIRSLLKKESLTPFNLSDGPLIKVALYQRANDNWVFYFMLHHIITDGWSMNNLIKEVLVVYESCLRNKIEQLQPLRIQYKDFAAWQREQLSGEYLSSLKSYWLKKLSGDLPVLVLPSDKVRPVIKTYRGSLIKERINSELSNELKDLAKTEEGTLFMVLLASVKALFYKYSGQQDIIIGTPVAGREHSDLEEQIGFYVNSLALRTQFDKTDTSIDLISKVKETVLGAFEHQLYPFDKLVESLDLKRDISRSAIYDVEVLLRNKEDKPLNNITNLSGLGITEFEASDEVATRFDLVFNFVELEGEIELVLIFNQDVFSKKFVGKMFGHLLQIMKGITSAPNRALLSLELLTDSEKDALLPRLNGSNLSYSKDSTLVSMFQNQASSTPNYPSIHFGGEFYSYQLINEKSNQLANHLIQEYKLKQNDLVGILLDRSEKMVVSILAVMISGAAYVPIEASYPKERVQHMIEDAGVNLVITQSDYLFDIDFFEGHVFAIDLQLDTLEESINLPIINSHPDDLAYVIYTSGSTGKPKGVMVQHKAIVNTVFSQHELLNLQPGKKTLQFSSISFDASVWEMFACLTSGGCLYIIEEQVKKSPDLIAAYIRENEINIATLPPAYLKLLDISKIQNLDILITAGEPANASDAKEFSKYGKYFNAYGPTETSICATIYELNTSNEDKDGKVPIGQPLPNTSAYILDDSLQLIPVGLSGEICIGGSGLAKGYLNHSDLTKSKFIKNPITNKGILYRTGDLGKYLPDGNIVFLGRLDNQVKINGYRVELNEIERALQKHKNVMSARIISRVNDDGTNHLEAYVVSKSELNVNELRGFLSKSLPFYMIPAHFAQLQELPLTSNGKLDEKALLLNNKNTMLIGAEYMAPQIELEEKIVTIWEKVLNKNKIGIKDNFFDLGGDSIKILRMTSELRNQLNIDIPIAEIYKLGNIKAILANFEQNQSDRQKENEIRRNNELKIKKEFEDLKKQVMSLLPVDQASKIEDIYPMSDIETGMVFESKLSSDLSIYHDQMIYHRSFANFCIERFTQALTLLTQKHSILRTALDIDIYKFPVQIVYKKIKIPISSVDLSMHDSETQKNEIGNYLENELKKPFIMVEAPLWRMRVFKVNKSQIIFVFQCHHAIIDGWSDSLLMTELNNLYLKLSEAPTYIPESLKLNYKDFIVLHELDKKDPTIREFWKKELDGFNRLDLFSNESEESKKWLFLNENELAALENSAALQNKSIKTLSLSAYLYTLRILTSSEDILTGVVTHTRPNREDGDKLLGCFLNTIPFRTMVNGNLTGQELIDLVNEKLVELKDKERLSTLEIALIHQESSSASNPFFDAFFNYVDFYVYDDVKVEKSSPKSKQEEGLLDIQGNSRTNFNLDFTINQTGHNYAISVHLRKKLKSGFGADKIGELYKLVLMQLANSPQEVLHNNDFISSAERKRLLIEFNDTKTSLKEDISVVQLFEEKAEKKPNPISLKFNSQHFTYLELNEKSNQLARYIREKSGIDYGESVCVLIDRSEWSVISMLSILKLGCVYIPIDKSLPTARITYMIKDSGARVIIADSEDDLQTNTNLHVIKPDSCPNTIERSNLNLKIDGKDGSFIIYTSGSTGVPKGVVQTHKMLLNLINWDIEGIKLRERTRLLQYSSFSFDSSLHDVLFTLSSGGEIHLVDEVLRKDLYKLTNYIVEERITTLSMPYAVLKTLFSEISIKDFEGHCIQEIISTGEQLYITGGLRSFLEINPKIEIYNFYGPTETHVVTGTKYSFSRGDVPDKASIGKPVFNTKIFILNEEKNMVPIGVPGEIYVAGSNLAIGYHNDLDKTVKRFISGSFINENRLYGTGDIGRWTPDGCIEYLARKDDQVKVNGYRIELQEIEKRLLSYSGVEEAIVIIFSVENENCICAYLKSTDEINIVDLRNNLKLYLPEYMLPTYFVPLKFIPLTSNGKLDKRALPNPLEEALGARAEYVAPRNEIETGLVEIWEEILGVSPIGIHDDFFSLGGHSLKVIRLVSHVNKRFGLKYDLRGVYEESTIEQIAEKIKVDIWFKESQLNESEQYSEIKI